MTTVYQNLTIASLKEMKALYSLGLLQMQLVRTFIYKFFCKHMFYFSGINDHNVIAGLCGSYMFSFVRNCQTFPLEWLYCVTFLAVMCLFSFNLEQFFLYWQAYWRSTGSLPSLFSSWTAVMREIRHCFFCYFLKILKSHAV